jgi:peroxiredoxin
MSLTLDLENLKREHAGKLPAIASTLFDNLIRDLKSRDFGNKALKVGDQIPSFVLPDALGKMVSSSDLLVRGPLVICFYRGAWCPYCNLELRALQEALPDILELGAQLVAISPMTPDNSLSLAEKHSLEFPVLSDAGLKVASQFGLVYQWPLEVRSFMEKAGVSLEKYNGDKSWKLPVAATYVTDHDGIVISAVNPDWRERLDPIEIISALQKLG